ncbi:MAG: MFS transporter [Tumebacillaceae bacterium]
MRSRLLFITLLLVVAISGMSQGLTLPLMATLLEKMGVSSLANGFNAGALYIGILLVSPLMELPLRKLGYRSTILVGLSLLTISTLLIPVFQGVTVWFVLRLLIGVGDMALHYSSQLWVTEISPLERRGRNLSIYGFAYGAGFSIGPQGMNLLHFGVWAPFLAIMVIYAVAFVLLSRLKNAYPQASEEAQTGKQRYGEVIRLGWIALIPPLLYGYMESTLSANFPVYAVRKGIPLEWVSMILSSFTVGSLILQMPLGRWSDRIGRKKVMMLCASVGAVLYLLLPLAGDRVWLMMLVLGLSGALVGSFYTMGLAYAADILPPGLLSTAGAIASINFGVANIVAPNLNGFLLETRVPGSMFVLLGLLLATFVVLGLLQRQRAGHRAVQSKNLSQTG